LASRFADVLNPVKTWPEFNAAGDLPVGIHPATLAEVVEHFGQGSPRRVVLGRRLERIFAAIAQTECVRRFIFEVMGHDQE
jgi:hypothetical protein